MALRPRNAESQFTVRPSQTNDSTCSTAANTRAPFGLTSPRGSGRLRVRAMTASMSRSNQQLTVLAAPAASEPPINVARTSCQDGRPPCGVDACATIIDGTVVISRSSMIRGLVSRKYDFATERADRRGRTSDVTAAGVAIGIPVGVRNTVSLT